MADRVAYRANASQRKAAAKSHYYANPECKRAVIIILGESCPFAYAWAFVFIGLFHTTKIDGTSGKIISMK